MKWVLPFLAVTAVALVPATASAAIPPIEYLAPANGSIFQLQENQDIKFEYPCPAVESEKGGIGYEIQIATNPALNPEGKFATPYRFLTLYGSATNAEENLCAATLSHVFLKTEQTLYWRIERPLCELIPSVTGEECEVAGPTWSFLVVPPPAKPPVTVTPPRTPITPTPTRPPVTASPPTESHSQIECRKWLRIDKARLGPLRFAARKFKQARTRGERNYWAAQVRTRLRLAREANRKANAYC
jgi:hypothetical protein